MKHQVGLKRGRGLWTLCAALCAGVWACGPKTADPDPAHVESTSQGEGPRASVQVNSSQSTPNKVVLDWPSLNTLPEQGGGQSDAALIIGIEDYAYAPDVPGAAQNAEDWYQYLVRTRKLPVGSVKLLRDSEATVEDMEAAASFIATKVKPGGTLWVVFIGHGAPAEDGQDGVLIGADAKQTALSLYRRSMAQRRLLKLLEGEQAQTLLIIDACFSGRTSEGAAFAEGLQPLLPVKMPDTITVLSAGATNEFAGPLPGAQRPAFSYLLLGAMRGWGDTDGDQQVTADEAVNYARDVLQTLLRDRKQTPQLSGPPLTFPLSTLKTPETGPDLASLVLQTSPSGAAPSSDSAPARVTQTPAPALSAAALKDMREVPAGEFWMGCNAKIDTGCGDDEKPGHSVYVDSFWIDRTEITGAAYAACVDAGACTPPISSTDSCQPPFNNWGQPDRSTHPVNCVSWDNANAFCKWIGKRLPTEAEWEKAARGTDGRIYVWGDSAPASAGRVANFADTAAKQAFFDWPVISGYEDGFATTAPVGSFPEGASPYGALDMAGNVFEWTASWYGRFDSAKARNPTGPNTGAWRVFRGGGYFLLDPMHLRVSYRGRAAPAYADSVIGFRCAYSSPSKN